MIGTEDGPAHQHPTLSFASTLGDVLYKGLYYKASSFENFCGLFCSNVPVSMFQTKTHIAVSIAGCSGEVVVDSHVELVDFML